jgi:primase-polymerase (primpol)-like protein
VISPWRKCALIPDALKREPRWGCWRYIQQDHRWPKVPHQISGHYAKANDASTCTTFDLALAAYQAGGFDGIGFFLADGWAGIDLDDKGSAIVSDLLSDLANSTQDDAERRVLEAAVKKIDVQEEAKAL